MVAGFNFILALLILVCELLSLFDCAVDFILGQVGVEAVMVMFCSLPVPRSFAVT